MKKILLITLSILMLITLVACGQSQQTTTPEQGNDTESTTPPESNNEVVEGEIEYPEMTFKLAHDAPIESPHYEAAENIKKEVEEASGGKITIEIYPLQQLGSAREMIEGMQMGSIEMVLLPTSKYGGFYQTLNIMDMPFLFPTEESTMKLFKSPLAEEIMSGLEDIGIHGNAFYSSGFKNFTNNKPIHSPEDFKGMKIRTQEAPIIMEMYKAWGASPVAIDMLELYNALQQKTVDGQENPFLSIKSLKIYEVQKYMAISKHSYLEYIMCSSKAWWDGLDDNTRKLIDESVTRNQQFCYDRLQEYNVEYIDFLKGTDMEIYELTAEEREKFREASQPVYEKFAKDIGADILQKVQDFLAKPENQ